MMPRTDPPNAPHEPLLFDLPLGAPVQDRPDRPAETAAERKRAVASVSQHRPEPVAAASPVARGSAALAEAVPEEEPLEEPADGGGRGGAGSRMAAGAADLLVHFAIAVVLLVGTRVMGVRPTLGDWPALAVFLLAFSFLYMVVPLAFWGHTLGMAWAGLVARNRDGEPLTFDQTARRWIGGLLTLALAGLPLLFAGHGRSLSDLLSGSVTLPNRV
jgi:uncharacterized RDD family membrane protein YckC